MLRNYTHNTLYKSFIKPNQLVSQAKERGWSFVGICDENTLSGMVDFYKACKDVDITPVIGCELSMEDEVYPLFALNRNGLNQLISACSDIGLGDGVTKDKIDSLIASDDIVLYQDHQTSRYLDGDLAEFKLIVNSNKEFSDEEKQNIIDTATPLKDYPNQDWVAQSKEIADKVEDYGLASKPILPSFPCPNNMTQDEFLRHLCRDGWRKQLKAAGKVDTPELEKEYADRVKYELEVLQGAGLSGYFLIVWDIMNFVRDSGWLPGPGRGSAAGCLVSYLTGITQTDPIEYNLLFGRFYNKSRNTATRVELPDIDLDIPSENRGEVLDYIKEKYGHENVCHIGTFGTFQSRSALEIAFKQKTDLPFSEIKEVTKIIPKKDQVTDKMEESEEESLLLWTLKYRPKVLDKWCQVKHAEDGEGGFYYTGDYAEVFKLAVEIEGIYRQYGKHAAAVVISPEPIKNVYPVRIDKDGDIVSTLAMKPVEYMGGLKLDILGVDILSKILGIVRKSEYIKDLEELNNFDDSEVWDLISSGNTKGVFQLDSNTGQTWAAKVKPKNIKELSDLSALLRPGALGASLDGKSMTQHYVDRKFGADFEYLHPALEPILKNSYGIIIYQEQAMKIATEIGGFSEELSDDLRKAIGKKNAKLMTELKQKFIDGCEKTGIVNSEVAHEIYDNIEKSNRYSFNASHSVVYAVNAYWSAYCKVHDTPIFFERYLNHAHKKPEWKDEIRDLVMDAKNFSLDVNPPNLSNLYKEFFYDKEKGCIFYGISRIKSVGDKESERFFKQIHETELKLGKTVEDFTWD
jgi:DNA polymerase-3 subunit alpha